MPVISGLETNAVTIGTSAIDTNNFQLRSNADGTATLARKSDGSGGDVLSIDSANNIKAATCLIVPSYTTTQKNALTPLAGMVILDTTLSKVCIYTGSAWQTVTST
jgi:hypothetical protein